MNKGVLVAVIAVLLLGGAFLFTRNEAPQVQVEDEQDVVPEENTVIYTDAGFSPGTLTVEAGTTVVFRNDSARSMWVASDPHPLHTDFPEFDAKSGIGSNQTYSFTFEDPGTYSYHDHLNPTMTGAIIVK